MSVSSPKGSLWIGAGAATALLLVLLFNLPAPSTPTAAKALRVQLDPETGEIVPVTGLDKAEFERQVEQRLNRSDAGLQPVHHADGSVSMDLEGHFQSLSIATTDSAGNLHTDCVSSKRELEQISHPTQQDKE